MGIESPLFPKKNYFISTKQTEFLTVHHENHTILKRVAINYHLVATLRFIGGVTLKG